MDLAEFLLEILPVRGVKYVCLFFILPPSFLPSFLLYSILFVVVVVALKKVCVCVCVPWRKAGVKGKEDDKLN